MKLLFGKGLLRSLISSSLGSLIAILLSIIGTAVTARFISPDKYAELAIFFAVQAILIALTDCGFRKALVFHQRLRRTFIDTVFAFNIFRAILLSLIVWFVVPILLKKYQYFEAIEYTRWLTLAFLIQGMRNPAVIYLTKRLRLSGLVLWEVKATSLKTIVLVVVLYMSGSPLAVVAGTICYEVIICASTYRLTKVRPNPAFSIKSFLTLFSYGRWVILSTLAQTSDRYWLTIFTASLVNPALISALSISQKVGQAPQVMISQVKNLLFPLFARLNSTPTSKESNVLSKNYYAIAMHISITCACILVAIVFFFDSYIIRALLGSSWSYISIYFSIIVGAMVIDSITGLNISLLNASGIPKYVFVISSLKLLTLIVSTSFLYDSYGPIGLCYGFLARAVIGQLASHIFCCLFIRNTLYIALISILVNSIPIVLLWSLGLSEAWGELWGIAIIIISMAFNFLFFDWVLFKIRLVEFSFLIFLNNITNLS